MWQFDKFSNKLIPGTLPANGKITACYTRLSQEDELTGDSGSILNQRDFLLKYCMENHFENIRFFSDDGFTGVNFDRPGFAEMMELVEQGQVSTIVVKDHSRLGRNRLKVGLLMDRFTEDYGIRYIAVTDNIDSDKGLDDMVAVRELFNEFYPLMAISGIKTAGKSTPLPLPWYNAYSISVFLVWVPRGLQSYYAPNRS